MYNILYIYSIHSKLVEHYHKALIRLEAVCTKVVRRNCTKEARGFSEGGGGGGGDGVEDTSIGSFSRGSSIQMWGVRCAARRNEFVTSPPPPSPEISVSACPAECSVCAPPFDRPSIEYILLFR